MAIFQKKFEKLLKNACFYHICVLKWYQGGGKWRKVVDSIKEVRRMLIGEYAHSIDAKGRLIVPAKFRTELGERFIVTIIISWKERHEKDAI